MSIHLVIIDALNLIRRVHAAQPDERDIQRTRQNCCAALKKIIKHSQPTHIIAVFDDLSENKGWRAELLPSYKAGRKPMPTALFNGIEQIQDDFFELGVDSLISTGDEADDLIATLSCKLAAQQHQVTIISTDKGYCQLLQPTLKIRDYFQERWLDSTFIQHNFEVSPHQLTDYWGLAGVNGTGISGVPGIGKKSAAQLLQTYGDLETILNSEDLPEKWMKKIAPEKDMARKSKQAATLRRDILLGFNLKDIRFQPTVE